MWDVKYITSKIKTFNDGGKKNMDLIKWNPFKDLSNMTKDFDNFFDGFEEFFAPTSTLKFDMDVWEDNEKNMFFVKCQLPGIKKEDIDVSLNGDVLTITAKQEDKKEAKVKYFRKEITSTSYQRSIRIPFDINKNEVIAEYKDGFLTISIPKSNVKSPNKIEVK
jgi:HSP20 family protein